MFIPSAPIHMLKPCPQDDIGRWGLAGGDQVTNGVSALTKLVPQLPLCEDIVKVTVHEPGSGPSLNIASTDLDLRFP